MCLSNKCVSVPISNALTFAAVAPILHVHKFVEDDVQWTKVRMVVTTVGMENPMTEVRGPGLLSQFLHTCRTLYAYIYTGTVIVITGILCKQSSFGMIIPMMTSNITNYKY